MRKALLVLALACWPSLADATTYSVKAAGGGNYTTIQQCAAVATAGDTWEVYAGTYTGSITPTNNGAAGNYLTFKAHSGDTVTLTGTIYLTNKNYIVIDGFRFTLRGLSDAAWVSATCCRSSRKL